ncbi:MAG: dynamin family protein [Verrucomicrobia bacterium]|nr:dynamin family protein [Verrucomicrobiota bacterium]
MNDNHQRHLVATFQHMDKLLSEAEHALATAGSGSPFAEYTQDSTPVQRKVIHDYVQRVREAMRHAMADLSLPRPAPVCGARWAARGHITFAQIAVAEMEPKRMRGYGALSEADIKAIDAIVAELNAALERLSAYFDKGPAADLQGRLRKLEQTRDEVPLLRELERVISAHGLVEFRGALTMLLDRLENHQFEIGVFGRVSSGKSSLLNHLLGAEVLPVGVTPVTAIPTRVRFGPAPRALIAFAERKPVEVELAQLAEFSTEQQNPGNAKHVARILVEVPAARLREGVTLVDTPGLGSLATSGAEETVAYLPRCDLGLVLVDAASTLTHEDLVVVQALYQAGARAMVLVSKADLLQPGDRERTLAYAKHQLAGQLGVEPPVRLVSVVGADATLCEAWFEGELKPLFETHREQAAASLKRKIGGLREAVVKTLETRLHGASPGMAAPAGEVVAKAITALRNADYLLESGENKADELVEQTPRLAEAIIDVATAQLEVAWRGRNTTPDQTAEFCGAAVRRALLGHTGDLVRLLDGLHEQLEHALARGREALPDREDHSEPLPKPPGLPIFDATSLMAPLRLQRPPFARLLGGPWLRRYARRRLAEQLRAPVSELLDSQRLRLRQWLRQTFTELRAAFHARAGLLRGQLEARAATATAETDAASVTADLNSLREQCARWH